MSFLDIDKICPVCGNERKLYLQVGDKVLKKTSENIFTSFKCCNKLDFVEIIDERNFEIKTNLDFNNKIVTFYMVCNEDVFSEYSDYNPIICVLYSCSIIQSDIFKFSDGRLKAISNKFLENNIAIDSLSYNDKTDFCYRFYNVNYDYINDCTKFYKYDVPIEKENDITYLPEIFEKQFPLFYKSPSELKKINLSNKTKMIEKFDSWMILS